MEPHYSTLKEFWPFYLSQHQNPWNRFLHVIGSSGALVCLFYGIWEKNGYALLFMPLCGYGGAWIGHFFVEKNRPATFTYPVKSFLSDWVMFYFILTGKISKELEKISNFQEINAEKIKDLSSNQLHGEIK